MSRSYDNSVNENDTAPQESRMKMHDTHKKNAYEKLAGGNVPTINQISIALDRLL